VSAAHLLYHAAHVALILPFETTHAPSTHWSPPLLPRARHHLSTMRSGRTWPSIRASTFYIGMTSRGVPPASSPRRSTTSILPCTCVRQCLPNSPPCACDLLSVPQPRLTTAKVVIAQLKENIIHTSPFTEEEVLEAISQMEHNKAPRPDF
jgi:hypothetical protein